MSDTRGVTSPRAAAGATRARDYDLLGVDGRAAVAAGLAGASWYCPPISRKRLAELMRRRDAPAIRDTVIWLLCLVLTGTAGVLLWGSGWAAIPFAVYGVLYGSVGDSRWHECGHGTAFKTQWLNESVHQLASFMMLREPTIWRYSHRRHHRDTIIVGLDPEIVATRPPDFLGMGLNLFALKGGLTTLLRVARHALGRMSAAEESFVPPAARQDVYRIARIWLSIFAAVLVACFLTRSILPAMLVVLPTFYGGWLTPIFGWTQHAGLAEDVLDHRLNTRTIYLNPLARFLYWNMNYHLEHHMFPMVPYHALPQLHQLVRPYCPEPYSGLLAAYREIIQTWLRQRRDPTYGATRPLPAAVSSSSTSDRQPPAQE